MAMMATWMILCGVNIGRCRAEDSGMSAGAYDRPISTWPNPRLIRDMLAARTPRWRKTWEEATLKLLVAVFLAIEFSRTVEPPRLNILPRGSFHDFGGGGGIFLEVDAGVGTRDDYTGGRRIYEAAKDGIGRLPD